MYILLIYRFLYYKILLQVNPLTKSHILSLYNITNVMVESSLRYVGLKPHCDLSIYTQNDS